MAGYLDRYLTTNRTDHVTSSWYNTTDHVNSSWHNTTDHVTSSWYNTTATATVNWVHLLSSLQTHGIYMLLAYKHTCQYNKIECMSTAESSWWAGVQSHHSQGFIRRLSWDFPFKIISPGMSFYTQYSHNQNSLIMSRFRTAICLKLTGFFKFSWGMPLTP